MVSAFFASGSLCDAVSGKDEVGPWVLRLYAIATNFLAAGQGADPCGISLLPPFQARNSALANEATLDEKRTHTSGGQV